MEGQRPTRKEAAFKAGQPGGGFDGSVVPGGIAYRVERYKADFTTERPAVIPPGWNWRQEQEVHYGGTPIVILRLVNGVQQDIAHLYTDSRGGGQTRWWVERESIASWQQRVRAAKAQGDERYRDISADRIPSSVTHNFPDLPAGVVQHQPDYTHREWVTYHYSLSPNGEGESLSFQNAQPPTGELEPAQTDGVEQKRQEKRRRQTLHQAELQTQGRKQTDVTIYQGQQQQRGYESGAGEQEQQEHDLSHEEMVKRIRAFVAEKRAEARKKGAPFNPFWCLRDRFVEAREFGAGMSDVLSDERYRGGWKVEVLTEKGAFIHTLQYAWDALTYDFYTEEEGKGGIPDFQNRGYKAWIRERLWDYSTSNDDRDVSLTEATQIALLDAMAEAVNIPHQRGQRVIPLPSSIR